MAFPSFLSSVETLGVPVLAYAAAIASFCWRGGSGRRRVRRPSVAAPPPLWLAAVGPDLKNDIEHAEDEERQAGTVDQAEIAAALREASPALRRWRLGDSEHNLLASQNNLACTYEKLGRKEEAMRLKRDVYYGYMKLVGEEHGHTLLSAGNYAVSLMDLKRHKEAKALLRKTVPVARRVLGENDETTLRARHYYARVLYQDKSSTFDEFREAVTTFEDTARTARRVLGGAHPVAVKMEGFLRDARAELRARETRA